MGGTAFLAAQDGGGIFELNAVGLAVWEILARSASPREVADTLAKAFPNEPPAAIRRDVTELMRRMWTANLLQSHALARNPIR